MRDRNKPCECGSGVKRKRCLCHVVNAAHEEALWWNEEFDRRKSMRELHGKVGHVDDSSRMRAWEFLALSQMMMR